MKQQRDCALQIPRPPDQVVYLTPHEVSHTFLLKGEAVMIAPCCRQKLSNIVEKILALFLELLSNIKSLSIMVRVVHVEPAAQGLRDAKVQGDVPRYEVCLFARC